MPEQVGTLDGQVALVTGAAQGVGKETAQKLAAAGAAVTVMDINGEGAEKAAEEIRDAGGRAISVQGDVAVAVDVQRMVAQTVAEFGVLHVLVNNAVVYDREIEGQDIDVVTTTDEVWARTMAVNFHGAVLGIRYAIPAMLAAGGGSIVNVGSTAGFSGDTVHVAYAASMAAKYSLTRSTATTHGHLGIRCNAIASGLVLSPTAEKNLNEAKLEAYRANLLSPDFARPGDLASVVVFLASPESRFINGQTIIADGGFQAHQPWHAQNSIVHPTAPLSR